MARCCERCINLDGDLITQKQGNQSAANNTKSKASQLAHEAVSELVGIVGHGGTPFFGIAPWCGGGAPQRTCVSNS